MIIRQRPIAALSLAAAVAAGAGFALAEEPATTEVTPGKGLSLDIGPKHTMTYFEPKDGGCGVTMVVVAKGYHGE